MPTTKATISPTSSERRGSRAARKAMVGRPDDDAQGVRRDRVAGRRDRHSTPRASCGSSPIETNSVVPIAKPPVASASSASPGDGAWRGARCGRGHGGGHARRQQPTAAGHSASSRDLHASIRSTRRRHQRIPERGAPVEHLATRAPALSQPALSQDPEVPADRARAAARSARPARSCWPAPRARPGARAVATEQPGAAPAAGLEAGEHAGYRVVDGVPRRQLPAHRARRSVDRARTELLGTARSRGGLRSG